ncbi:MAG TPA: hypothetical protein PKA30_08760 [Accumulibacter sp.]|uniref:hypothetical protein n=1 Tax=Accumulibacter sp. TaxID=2053492 RepID=UPI00287B511B|nr:hypothetical protein [Accumulibacter sp.]MDS4056675.1 hypothetical protein [Accumulibacter sp.]HMV05627.1 hypothetical protein [Accumulibacter sp.]HMW63270.1 hypothetical protein [Accumulibacter sp.]HMW79219.1 hypothetical protein [Accumulibacter sp.]HND37594.1 hypothetical protein [Accumulibacter sp.]
MSGSQAEEDRRVAIFDDRPFFERALVYGCRHGIIDAERLQHIRNDAPKGMVQIADYFGTQYLRANIEEARSRMVNLVSLYLEDRSGGDLARAARSLRDNSFLSHSRGGSEMLKRLWAMPEDSSHGLLSRQSQKDFLAVWSLRTLVAYREGLAQRQKYQSTISAGLWFAEQLGVRPSELSTIAAESVIRSALLVRLSGSKLKTMPSLGEFASMLENLRRRGRPARRRSALDDLWPDLPQPHHEPAERELRKFLAEDLPCIVDASLALGKLVRDLEPLYFLREFDAAESGQLLVAASREWQRMTAGKTDDSSLLTVFVCVAAGLPGKPALTRSEARKLLRQARRDGLQREPVLAFIRSFAPGAMQDDLAALWIEFFPEASSYLLDASDDTLSAALEFLDENCVLHPDRRAAAARK